MMEQRILKADETYSELDAYLNGLEVKRVLLVCGTSFWGLRIADYFETLEERLGIKTVRFTDFESNPLYESVEKGTHCFREWDCEMIIAVGGGSAMDVAKCIKLYANMKPERCYLEQQIIPNTIQLLAVPTTAGTGSEATKYAVIYYHGEKQSVTHESCIPQTVLLDPSLLCTLPEYQRKATMLDTLCHAVESFWSVNSTEESREYAKEAIEKFLAFYEAYLRNEEEGNSNMLYAANLAGKAINITQTTAGHAMSYKLTSMYGIAHGHAAGLCVAELFEHMIMYTKDACVDNRGYEYVENMLGELAETMGCRNINEAAEKFRNILYGLKLQIPEVVEADFSMLAASVNTVRLRNHPISLKQEEIIKFYRKMLSGKTDCIYAVGYDREITLEGMRNDEG